MVISSPDLNLSCFPTAKMGSTQTPQVAVLHKGTKVSGTPAPDHIHIYKDLWGASLKTENPTGSLL